MQRWFLFSVIRTGCLAIHSGFNPLSEQTLNLDCCCPFSSLTNTFKSLGRFLFFQGKYNNWDKVDPAELFSRAPTEKKEANPKLNMVKFLQVGFRT